MDLSDALGDAPTWPSAPGGGAGAPAQGGGGWPSAQPGGGWPSGGGGPSAQAGGGWPSGGGGPSAQAGGGWPSGGGGPSAQAGGGWPSAQPGGGWPSGGGGPSAQAGGGWPSAQPGGGWPSGGGGPSAQAGGGAWPNQPTQPNAPGGWPTPSPGGPAGPTGPSSLPVPHRQTLPNGVFNKLLITIAGKIKPNANMITVDLGSADGLALHFNPRFNDQGRKVVVRNSCVGNKWGQEERELGRFPFVQGGDFEIKILCTDREFRVAVNGAHLLEFKHRMNNLRNINKLSVYNDLTLSKVNVETVP
ncbi:galectin-3-like [Genypterus blacodes]|uniref:galectin-3-like n=1 Tax=Genypterus blacodes TaxID=154954 RepID=UPI003F764082